MISWFGAGAGEPGGIYVFYSTDAGLSFSVRTSEFQRPLRTPDAAVYTTGLYLCRCHVPKQQLLHGPPLLKELSKIDERWPSRVQLIADDHGVRNHRRRLIDHELVGQSAAVRIFGV